VFPREGGTQAGLPPSRENKAGFSAFGIAHIGATGS